MDIEFSFSLEFIALPTDCREFNHKLIIFLSITVEYCIELLLFSILVLFTMPGGLGLAHSRASWEVYEDELNLCIVVNFTNHLQHIAPYQFFYQLHDLLHKLGWKI